MTSRLQWYRNAELPQLQVWWRDDSGDLIDFSSGVSDWELRIGDAGGYAMLVKTSGIAGAVGSGTETNGTPNVIVDWFPGELDIVPDVYTLQIVAHYSGFSDRVMTAPLRILPVVGDIAP